MVRAAGQRTADAGRGHKTVRVALLIPTHALPPLSYRVPARLRRSIGPGTLVVVPLSGRSRLGIVLGDEEEPDRHLEEILSVAEEFSIPPDLLKVCEWAAGLAATPLSAVLRAALPPGFDAGTYAVVGPDEGWAWKTGDRVSRAALKKVLGAEGLRRAEEEMRILLSPSIPPRKTVEWVVVREAGDPDLSRAPRQRELFELVKERGALPTANLLSQAGGKRATLRELVRRGAVRLAQRHEPIPLLRTSGDEAGGPLDVDASRAVGRGGAFVWRVPTAEEPEAVAAVARAVIEEGRQVLVLAPEIGTVERVAHHIARALPPGRSVAPYHSGLGKDRTAVFEAARRGEIDVVVGTRAAAFMPLDRPGAFCLVDEHDESHRAEPGFEGIPIHARDVAIARGRAEDAAVICASPTPSLRLFAAERRGKGRVRELPARPAREWPSVRLVDMRGSGAVLSSALIRACRAHWRDGKRVGVVADRLGYASTVSCNRCGAVRHCTRCGRPLAAHGSASKTLVCPGCGHKEDRGERCEVCGSDRTSFSGVTVERVRDDLSAALGAPVGLLTAARREADGAPVAVGTARSVLEEAWDAVLLPDVDASLLGSGIGASERSFRLIHRAAEAAGGFLLIQTRVPDNAVLRAAAAGDYDAFVAFEVPRLRSAGYPPFGHLAGVVLSGRGETVLGAVESWAHTGLGAGVKVSDPVPVARAEGRPAWKVLIRSRDRRAVARAAGRVARLAAGTHGLQVRVVVDPEEV